MHNINMYIHCNVHTKVCRYIYTSNAQRYRQASSSSRAILGAEGGTERKSGKDGASKIDRRQRVRSRHARHARHVLLQHSAPSANWFRQDHVCVDCTYSNVYNPAITLCQQMKMGGKVPVRVVTDCCCSSVCIRTSMCMYGTQDGDDVALYIDVHIYTIYPAVL